MTVIATDRRASPYQGLIPFGRDDWKYFFGRERDIDRVVANLYAEPLTLLYGATGVGKTSTLRAGVLHRLDDEEDAAAVMFDSWQGRGDARLGLRRAISAACNGTPDENLSLLPAVEALVERSNRNVMIILDQFEEYFLYHRGGDPLDDELAELLTQGYLPVSCLLSLREDALAALDRFKETVPELFDNILRFDHLDHDSAVDAIVKPLERYAAEYSVRARASRNLPERVVGDLERASRDRFAWGPGDVLGELRIETPYLQLIMDELWRAEQADGSYTIHRRTLDRLQGTKGIVHTYLDKRLGALDETEQDTASQIFRFLVTPSGSKIALTADDLADFADLPATTIPPVLEKLVASGWLLRRILPPDGNPDRARYELVHDILAEQVSDWRKRRLERIAEAERLIEHGTTLGAVVDAYLQRRREEGAGRISAETDSRYQAQLAAFQKHRGEIVSAWFGAGNAVVLTRRPGPKRRLRDDKFKLHRLIAAPLADEDLQSLMLESDAIALGAYETLGPQQEQLVLRQLFSLESSVLAAMESAEEDLSDAWRVARLGLERTRSYAETSAMRAAQLVYLKGVALGVIVVGALVGTGLLVVALAGDVTDVVRNVATVIGFGALGATISVLQRMTAGAVAIPYTGISRDAVRLLGAFRPAIGAIFGLSLYLLVGTGLLPGIDSTSWTWLTGVAFLGGFAERFAQDLVTSTKTTEPPQEAPKSLGRAD